MKSEKEKKLLRFIVGLFDDMEDTALHVENVLKHYVKPSSSKNAQVGIKHLKLLLRVHKRWIGEEIKR